MVSLTPASNPLPHRGRGGTARESERWVRAAGTEPAFAPSPQPSPDGGEGALLRAGSTCLRLLLEPFDKAGGLRVRALPNQGDNRDLVALHLVDAPNDDPLDAGSLDKADAQLGLDHGDIAGHVFADDLPAVLGRHAALQLLLDRGLADARGPAQAAILDDRVIAIQGK